LGMQPACIVKILGLILCLSIHVVEGPTIVAERLVTTHIDL